MQGEFAFFGDLAVGPERPKRPERLFFAVLPDPETADRVRTLIDRFVADNHLTGTPLKAERLHISLHHVGDYARLRSKFVYAARLAGQAVTMRSFEVTFRFIKSFDGAPSHDDRSGRRPLVLLAEGDALGDLHKAVRAAMARNGLRPTPSFRPHMTLLYGAKLIPMQAIAPISFPVSDFVLIHSALGLTRYEILDRWPLQA